jgi:alkanesulfonate monooxygenase SsuD/methylene tetrahydromethanopterin reductase-like flavin-dependent oxidoreductase (luciferase family)
MAGMRSALWLPLFDDLADPVVAARLAAEAEQAGWHGFFVWDHLNWQAPVRQVADPWITLAAAAAATEHVRLGAAWSGEPVHHRGEHYTVDAIRFLPRPVQQPGIPVWVAGFPGSSRPLRRAARHDGFFPVNLEHPDQFAEVAAAVTGLRQGATAPYDIAVALPPGTDPAPYARAGATWWLTELGPGTSIDRVRGVLRDGPAA